MRKLPYLINDLKHSFLNLIYPPLCLHCEETLFNESPYLCDHCLKLIEFIDSSLHCKRCFSLRGGYKTPFVAKSALLKLDSDFSQIAYDQEDMSICEKPNQLQNHQIWPPKRVLQPPLKVNSKKHKCDNCFSKKSSLTAVAATFDYIGPMATLVKKLKYENKPYLAEGLAAYMAVQLIELKWPLPDLIIPVPQSLARFYVRGYNQAELLSRSLSTILNCPVQKALIRTSDDYSQAGLNHEQRLKLTGQTISLRKDQHLQDKTILLVDDVLTTGMTLQRCAESILEGCPNSIYGLTVCHAS